MTDLVERLRELSGDDHERLSCNARYAECSCGYTARMEAAVAEAASEITRLRSLLEEAKGVLGPFAESVADTIADDQPDDWAVEIDQGLTYADLRAASSLLKRLEG